MASIEHVTHTVSIMTAGQLLDMPDDGNRYELIEGVRQMMSPTGGQHGIVAARILRKLGNYVEETIDGDPVVPGWLLPVKEIFD